MNKSLGICKMFYDRLLNHGMVPLTGYLGIDDAHVITEKFKEGGSHLGYDFYADCRKRGESCKWVVCKVTRRILHVAEL